MRIDQLEGRSLEPHLEALQRSMPRLAGQREPEVPADARRPAHAADGSSCGEVGCCFHNVG